MLAFEWAKRLGKIVLLACLLPTGCFLARVCGDYTHFEFEPIPGMSVLETRVPVLDGLSGLKPFPVSYALKRSSYQIALSTDEGAYGATITLSVKSSSEEPMTLKLVGYPRAPNGKICISDSKRNGSVKFFWQYWVGCVKSQIVNIAVMDAAGVQVAVEHLPFKVVTNGRWCVTDAL